MINIYHKGNFNKTLSFIKRVAKPIDYAALDAIGKVCLDALIDATPVNTGKTARSWRYEIVIDKNSASVEFCNDNIQNGVPIALVLQYGHGTRNGGYVVGRDYINPAVQPIFDAVIDDLWKEEK